MWRGRLTVHVWDGVLGGSGYRNGKGFVYRGCKSKVVREVVGMDRVLKTESLYEWVGLCGWRFCG